MNTVTAINKKYQKNVNAFVRWNAKYDALVDAGKDETQQSETAYEKAFSIYNDLPKRERANINKNVPHVKGTY